MKVNKTKRRRSAIKAKCAAAARRRRTTKRRPRIERMRLKLQRKRLQCRIEENRERRECIYNELVKKNREHELPTTLQLIERARRAAK